ncbi:Uncharacterized protein Adt_17782 [Abeliophyllum distichum]|uniref:Uncharacterized protein n=1 Tax=Abeliophyllum distichum TaxID=126358 RepID=A0ABD1THH8_9LAMI
MAAKCPRREKLPSPSSDEEAPPPEQRIDKCPIPVGKNVDLASFTFDTPSFHIEDYLVAMGWVSLVTLDEKVYPNIIKEFYKDLVFYPGSGITCMVRNKRLKITRDLIHSILHLEDCDLRIFSSKTIPHLEGYNPIEAYSRVMIKHFEEARRLSSNQLTLPCRVLHNIISHILVPRKCHLDEDGQWVAQSKGFDDESGPSTLPFEGGEEMGEDEDEPPPRPSSHQPPSSTSDFTFTEDHYNLLNGRIDSLASTIDGLQLAVSDLQNTAATIQTTVGGLQTSVNGITSLLHALHSHFGT